MEPELKNKTKMKIFCLQTQLFQNLGFEKHKSSLGFRKSKDLFFSFAFKSLKKSFHLQTKKKGEGNFVWFFQKIITIIIIIVLLSKGNKIISMKPP